MQPVGNLKQKSLSITAIWQVLGAPYWLLFVLLFTAGYWITGVTFDTWWFIGALFFTFPFTSWLLGRARAHAQNRVQQIEVWGILLIANIPFWLVFSGKIGGAVVLWFAVLVLVSVFYQGFRNGLKHVPGLEVLATGILFASPYVIGVLLRDPRAIWWLPGWIALVLWLMGCYVMYLINCFASDRRDQIVGTVHAVGFEKSLIVALGMFAVAAMLPAVYYGWQGYIASIIVVPFAVLVGQTLYAREHPMSPVFQRTWQAIKRYAYVSGVLLCAYLLAIQAFHW